MQCSELVTYLDELLETARFSDYGPNGLQVEGRPTVKKVVTAVSASVALFEKAIELHADTLLVHHGIIWNHERPLYRGGYKQRVKLLLEHDLNLIAYHLPLDAHLKFGNAAQIAGRLGLKNREPFGEHKGNFLGVQADAGGISYAEMEKRIRREINREALFFPYGPERIERMGIISGGGQKETNQAVLAGLDLYLTGEASEFVMHLAREEQIHFVAAGHYATERFGIQALGDHLAETFQLPVKFVDIPNPV